MEGQIRRIAQQRPSGSGAGITQALLTTAFGAPKTLPSGFHAYYTDTSTSLLHVVWTDGTTWYSVPVPAALGQVYTRRFLPFFFSSSTSSLNICGGASNVGFLLGRAFRIVSAYIVAYSTSATPDTYTLNIYRDAALIDSSCAVTSSGANQMLSAQVAVNLAYTAAQKLALKMVSSGTLNWSNWTCILEIEEQA